MPTGKLKYQIINYLRFTLITARFCNLWEGNFSSHVSVLLFTFKLHFGSVAFAT